MYNEQFPNYWKWFSLKDPSLTRGEIGMTDVIVIIGGSVRLYINVKFCLPPIYIPLNLSSRPQGGIP